MGPWLCGLHDNDKQVVGSVQEALSAVFPTEEKRLNLWKAYHGSILEYCTNAVLYEDTNTLSDERTTNKDDAEAKFSRTIGSALLTVARALEVLDSSTLSDQNEQYRLLLDSEKLWKLAESADPFLRQATYRLTLRRLEKLDASVDKTALQKMSKALLDTALRKDQTASTLQFVALLTALTKSHPDVWTVYFASKRTATANLKSFLEKLPALSSSEFWSSLRELLSLVPMEVIDPPTRLKDGSDGSITPLLAALHQGLSRKENFRAAATQAWGVYLALVERFASHGVEQPTLDRIANDFLGPLVRQYVLPAADSTSWTISGSGEEQRQICGQAFVFAAEISPSETEKFLESISAATVENMQLSLPEQSQGFTESQRKAGEAADRWNSLKALLLDKSKETFVSTTVTTTTEQEVRAAMQLLENRNGKPFGAALSIQSALSRLSTPLMSDGDFKQELERFLTQQGTQFVGTPSTAQILDLFQLVDKLDPSSKLYNKCLSEVLQQTPSPGRTNMLTFFIKSAWPSDAALSSQLTKQLEVDAQEFSNGDTARASQLEAVLANKSAPADLTDSILAKLVDALSVDTTTASSLKTISAATTSNKDALKQFMTTNSGAGLGAKLLLLSQSGQDSETKQLASDLGARTRLLSAGGANDEAATDALIKSIHEGLLNTQNASLTVDVLYGIADHMLQDAGEPTPTMSSKLLPEESDWEHALNPFLEYAPDPSLSLTNSLSGAIHWLDRSRHSASIGSEPSPKDSLGHTVPIRMAVYTSRLMERPGFVDSLDEECRKPLMSRLAVFDEVLTDHLSVPAVVPLSSSSIKNHDKDASEALWFNQTHWSDFIESKPDMSATVLTGLLEASKGKDLRAYYSARAYVHLASQVLNANPSALQAPEDELLQIVRKPTGSLYEAARFATVQQNSGRSKVANNLIAELARFNFEAQSATGLYLITLLNTLLDSLAFDESAFNQQHRLVIFVKHIIGSIHLSAESQALDSELFRALLKTAPFVKDIFDNFWTVLVDRLVDCLEAPWSKSGILAPALRLLRTLRSISAEEDTNDDLKESWAEKQPELAAALIKLMQTRAELVDDAQQPQRIVNGLVARQTDSLAAKNIESSSLYAVLGSRSFDLQNSAFKILDRSIPMAQEQLTLDAALSKDFKAKLPSELAALIIDAPSDIHDLAGADAIPSHLARYLFAWILIFDHWTNASHQIQLDYVTAIKEAAHLPSLLDLIFEATLNSRAKPLDPTPFSVTTFKPNLDESPETTVFSLLSRLYLLALSHIPALVRTWYRDDCPRALQKPVADWTERHFSPHIISAELSAVSAWAPAQESDTPLEVKLAPRARELTAMYPIDDQLSAIRISLPADYPLTTIAVESVNRVGVDEAKWQAWLLGAQGVMNFASSSGGLGAVVDGLVGWRRNVTGTLRGQSECAICYAIVNADRQLPTKKCGTCKNAFHGSCLYRWFRSSGGSSCPLCRNAFNYG